MDLTHLTLHITQLTQFFLFCLFNIKYKKFEYCDADSLRRDTNFEHKNLTDLTVDTFTKYISLFVSQIFL